MIELLRWEQRMPYGISQEKKWRMHLSEEQEYLQNLKIINDYGQLTMKVQNIATRSYSLHTNNDLEELKKITNHPLLNIRNTCSMASKSLFL